MSKEDYRKFRYIESASLSSLIEKLSMISPIEYAGILDEPLFQEEAIRKAQIIEPKIENIKDLNKYYHLLKNEIDKREKLYLKGNKLTNILAKEFLGLSKKLK